MPGMRARWRDKLRVWFKPPGWRPADVAARFPKPAFDIQRERFAPQLSRGLVLYSLVQFALLLGMGVQFLDLAKQLPAASLIGYAVFLLLSLYALGSLTEGHRGGVGLELVRSARYSGDPAGHWRLVWRCASGLPRDGRHGGYSRDQRLGAGLAQPFGAGAGGQRKDHSRLAPARPRAAAAWQRERHSL